MEFHLEYTFPSLNEALNAAKGHWSRWHRLKKSATEAMRWQIRQQKRQQAPLGPPPYSVAFTWPISPRADLDNLAAVGCKIILDALVLEDVLLDDTAAVVAEICHRAGPLGGPVVVTVSPVSLNDKG